MYTIYGIPNCDSVKKARIWLEQHHIDYEFHDYKKAGITKSRLTAWCRQLGWENLINTKGTTWRALGVDIQATVNSQTAAINIMTEYTSVIKRPVIEQGDKIVAIRFDEKQYERVFL